VQSESFMSIDKEDLQSGYALLHEGCSWAVPFMHFFVVPDIFESCKIELKPGDDGERLYMFWDRGTAEPSFDPGL